VLFDDYLGRLDPQLGHRRALISRYLSWPLLDLTDIGVYTIDRRVEIPMTPRLCHLGLHATTGMHPLPPSGSLLARAARGQLTTIDDGSAVVVELTALGQARLAAIGRADVALTAVSTARMSGSSPRSIARSPARSATGSVAAPSEASILPQYDAEEGTVDVPSPLIAWDDRDTHEQTNQDSAASDMTNGGGAAISGHADDSAEQQLTTQLADRQSRVPSLPPPFLDPDVARGHLALNPLRPLPPGEWRELLNVQQTYGAVQLLIWQARASRRAQAFARRARSLDSVRCPSRFRNVDLVPATLALEAVIQTAIPWEGREYVLLDMITPHLGEYDLILIDCRPGIDMSMTNALTATRWLLVPVECSFLALDGYDHVRALQQRLNARINPALQVLSLLPTRYRSGTAHAQAALAEIEQQVARLDLPLRFAPIRLAVAAADAPAHGMTLADFAPTSPIAQEYRCTAEQILHFLEGM
jgi:cellulose biosynthesis protein BcsQ